LGWRLQAGSVYRAYFGGSLQAVIFTDATGAEYRMEFASYNGTYQTVEGGLHLSMDWGSGVLHFPDGSIWTMGDGTAAAEQDAGTRYPTQMKDTNGNTVSLTYAPGVGEWGPVRASPALIHRRGAMALVIRPRCCRT
jgi:hypothetical protein